MMNKKFKHSFAKFIFLFALFISFATSNGQQISPLLVGNNVWYKNPSEQVWNLTKQAGVTTIRIGGADYDKNMPTNADLLNWVKHIQAMGAEPIMQVSQYGTAEKAAALVKYFNVDLASGKPIKYWNIGNEPWLQAGKPSVTTAGAIVEKYFKPMAEAMKGVDSTIKIFGPDFCYYIDEGMNDLFGGKNDISGKIPGKTYYYCDGISWHNYPQGSGSPAYEGVASFSSAIIKCKTKVDAVNKLRNRTGSEALEWGIGEFNSKGGPEVHTWDNGQMFGAVLGMCMQYEATYATTWSMFESSGNRTSTDFSFIDGNMTPRASYRHMQMIAKNFKGKYLKGKSTLSDIIVFGSKNGDTTSVMIMNRAASTPKAYTLYLNMTATTATGVRLNIDAASDTSYQDIIQGKATQLLVFKDGKIIKTTYTSVDFDNGKPPVESVVLIAQNVPAEPTALKSTTVSYKSILLEWTPSPTDTITGYLIERKMAGGTVFEPVAMVNNTSNSYTDIGLKDTTAYTYRIMAFNTAGKSGYSSESSATTLKVYRKAYNPPHTIPGKIQAEDYDNNDDGIGYHDADPNNQGSSYRLNQGVDVQKCTDTNGGFNVAYIANGEWLTFSLDSIKTGKYDINLRVASAQAGTNKVKFYLGDKLLGYVQPVSTGGWQTWQTLSLKNISISETDTHLLKLVFEGSNFNINWIEFVQIQSPTGFNQIETDNGFAKIFPNPTSDNIQIEISKTCLTADYVISDVLGNIQKTGVVKNGSNQVDISGLKNGIYLIRIKQNALGTMTQNIIKI